MGFILQGPYPMLQSTILLPSPKLGNQQNLASTVTTMRAMDGTKYTFVKPKRARKVYQWDFITTKDKLREVSKFIKSYSGRKMKVTDHRNNQYIGFTTINPLDARGEGRAGGYPSNEVYRWAFSLEESA